MFGTKPRYCYYTGKLYCKKCRHEAKRPIPGRILAYADTKPLSPLVLGSFDSSRACRYPVCDLAKSYLDAVHTVPCVQLSVVAPTLYKLNEPLKYVQTIRKQVGRFALSSALCSCACVTPQQHSCR